MEQKQNTNNVVAAGTISGDDLEILNTLAELATAMELGLPLGEAWGRSETAQLMQLRSKLRGDWEPQEPDPMQDKLF